MIPRAKFVLIAVALIFSAHAVCAQDAKLRTVHVFVALADNQHQGIVPVPRVLGDGDDPDHNLYWGSAYGVKTFFSHSSEWTRLGCAQKPKPAVLERCIFVYKKADVFLELRSSKLFSTSSIRPRAAARSRFQRRDLISDRCAVCPSIGARHWLRMLDTTA